MRYKVAQFRKEWNRAAKREHRLAIDNAELHGYLKEHHALKGVRYGEMQWWEAKDGTTHTIEF